MVIPFGEKEKKKYYRLLDKIFASNFWSEGRIVKDFEEKFSLYTGIESRAVSSGGAGLLAILDYIDVQGKDVVVPANTFWATVQAVKKAGANVIYADCNKEDLCLSYREVVNRVTPETRAVIIVHIGGHIAFEIQKIAEYCKANDIYLIEDCAHVHGARWNNKTGGNWGFAGAYSFYATKTITTGEGGMVVSENQKFLKWLEEYRNYGKRVENDTVYYPVKNGFNYRMSEFIAALGLVQMDRLNEILDWKRNLAHKYDQIFKKRVRFPEGMQSGYYKYIVFETTLKEKTGQVFGTGDLGYIIESKNIKLPNSEWIAKHHSCVPIYYGWTKSGMVIKELKKELLY